MVESRVARDADVLVGIDVGLSYLKVAAFDARGRLIASGSRSYATRRREDGRVEEDPDEWIALAADLIQQYLVTGAFRAEQVAGIGISARGSGPVFVDDNGEVLIWHWLDGRSADQSRRLREKFGHFADNRALPSRTLWLAENRPELFARLAHPIFAKDFVLYRLTGEVATDPSSGPAGLTWRRDVWEHIGFPVERVPAVRPHTEIGGYLLPSIAARFGLPAGIPVGIGGHDGACANAGAGAISIGQVCLTLGTNGVARAIAADPFPTEPSPGISNYHFLPGRLCRGGDMSLLGHMPTWLAGLVGEDFASLEEGARQVAPGSDGVVFLPFPHGQVSPEVRRNRRAAFVGLSENASRATLYRSVLEGTAGLIRLIADRLAEYGFGSGDWRASGGGTNSQLWLNIIASMLGRPLLITEPEEGPRGACMFLTVGLNWYESVEECAAEWVQVTRVVEPASALVDSYAAYYRRFQHFEQAMHDTESSVP